MLKEWVDRQLLFLARHSHTAAQRLTLVISCEVMNTPLRVPVMAGIGLQNTRIHPRNHPLLQVIRRVLESTQGAVVDVGCNIGHFMLLMLLNDRERRYVGFDPSLACCLYVERFIQENGLTNHTVLPLGLADAMAIRELGTNAPFDVCASFSRAAHTEGRFLQRRQLLVERGDAVLSQLGLDDIALVKIDVEGLELEVLQGLDATLREKRPFVIFEVLPYADLSAGAAADPQTHTNVAAYRQQTALALTRLFEEQGYLFHRICQNGELKALEDLDPRDFSNHLELDHLAVPRERAAAFLHDFYLKAPSPDPTAAASVARAVTEA